MLTIMVIISYLYHKDMAYIQMKKLQRLQEVYYLKFSFKKTSYTHTAYSLYFRHTNV